MSTFALERRVDTLAREIQGLRTALETMLGHLQELRVDAGSPAIPPSVKLAEAILESRRLREDLFGSEMFADPAWDILLHLFINAERGQPVPASCLCAASAVPQSTALRWIETLAESGLLVRRVDAQDGRRVLITLSGDALKLMRLHLHRARISLLLLGNLDGEADIAS